MDATGQRALAHFADLEDGKRAVVDLRNDGTAWRFQHILAVSGAQLEAFGALAE